jgi:hypothetical protein
VAVVALLLAGCGPGVIALDSAAPEGGTPGLVVAPAELDFGEVEPGESAAEAFTLYNPGDGALTVSELRVEGEAFALAGADALVLGARSTVEVEVAFTAPEEMGTSRGAVVLTSDARGDTRVALRGVTPGAALSLGPPLDLGRVPVGCAVEGTALLANRGPSSAAIEAIEVEGDGLFSLVHLAEPLDLGPHRSRALPVRFAPAGYGPRAGALRVYSGEQVLELALRGVGAVEPWVEDSWDLGAPGGEGYRLSMDPDLDTLTVSVNEEALAAEDWSWVAATNAVEVETDALPPGGALIARYRPRPDCGGDGEGQSR